MKIAEILMEEGFSAQIQKRYKLTQMCGGMGYSEEKDRWYGWSHRAVCSFGKGDKIFEPNFGDDKTDFRKHGSKTIKTFDDMKKAAQAFSRYVS